MQKLQQTCHSFPFKGQVITMGRPDLALHLLIPIVEYIDYHVSEKWINLSLLPEGTVKCTNLPA